MAGRTTNLNLKLLGVSESDKATLFEDWRQDINGEGNASNMQIIDRAYGQLAEDIDELGSDIITEEQVDAMFSGEGEDPGPMDRNIISDAQIDALFS